MHKIKHKNTSHLPDTVGTNTCGEARYGRLTTDTSVDRAFILTDCTILQLQYYYLYLSE